jgi:hypothetical protein
MNPNNRETKTTRIIIVLSCSILVFVSLITFQAQIPTISKTTKIYDKGYISALKNVGNLIPQNETLITSENYPQVTYFTDQKVKVPWRADSERSLVQYMLKINSSNLLVPDETSPSEPDTTPLFIQLVEKPFEKIFDYYYDYISLPKTNNIMLKLDKVSKEKPFERLFEKISEHNTEGSILHLYRLRSNITLDNLGNVVTDSTRPILFVLSPVNGTIIKSKSDVFRLNITGITMDEESKVKNVEISVNDSVFHPAKPRAPNDWSTWSFSYNITSEGIKRILTKAMDNADNTRWVRVNITIV